MPFSFTHCAKFPEYDSERPSEIKQKERVSYLLQNVIV